MMMRGIQALVAQVIFAVECHHILWIEIVQHTRFEERRLLAFQIGNLAVDHDVGGIAVVLLGRVDRSDQAERRAHLRDKQLLLLGPLDHPPVFVLGVVHTILYRSLSVVRSP